MWWQAAGTRRRAGAGGCGQHRQQEHGAPRSTQPASQANSPDAPPPPTPLASHLQHHALVLWSKCCAASSEQANQATLQGPPTPLASHLQHHALVLGPAVLVNPRLVGPVRGACGGQHEVGRQAVRQQACVAHPGPRAPQENTPQPQQKVAPKRTPGLERLANLQVHQKARQHRGQACRGGRAAARRAKGQQGGSGSRAAPRPGLRGRGKSGRQGSGASRRARPAPTGTTLPCRTPCPAPRRALPPATQPPPPAPS